MAENIAPQKWYSMTEEEVAANLKVDPKVGLSSAEAEARLKQYGPNQLAEKKKEPGWQAFLRQYKDFMQILLLGAAVVNQLFTGESGTTAVLVILTIFNAILGLRGESKAEASMAALSKTMKSITRVRRDGEAKEIEAEGLVPGDIVLMEAGNLVPADGRLFVAATMEIEEAALTGESVATLEGRFGYHQARSSPWRPHQHGFHEYLCYPRSRGDDRNHNRYEHRNGAHRRPVE